MLTSPFFNIDAISWYHIDVGFIIGDQIARKKIRMKSDRGVPKLFQEIVQYWVAFDLVKILHRFGLKPAFNESLHEWSPELYSLVMVLGKKDTSTEMKDQADRCISTLFDVTTTEHYGNFTRTGFGTKKNFKNLPNFEIPIVILTWNRMLQEYFLANSEYTFFGLGDYSEQKKKNTAAPYDNMFLSVDGFEEFKVDSFSCFQPHEALERSPDVCPSLFQWAEYLLTPAIESESEKKERLHKLGEKPMQHYYMTHTPVRSRPQRDKTVAAVDTATIDESTNQITQGNLQDDAQGGLQVGVDMSGAQEETEAQAEDAREEATTSSYASAEEELTTNVLLLHRMGEALQAAKRTHDTTKRKSAALALNEMKVNDGIASLVRLVQSIYKDERQLDFEGAMDRLDRESKMGKPLLIDLTTQEEEGTSSNSSSDSSGNDSDDSDYKAGDDCKKKKARREQIETRDKGEKRQNENENLTMLSRVCGDVSEKGSDYTDEQIIVNEDNCGYNENFLNNLFDAEKDQMNRDKEEDKESGDASNKHDTHDNISINQDLAVNTEEKRKKKKKQSSDVEENNSEELSDDKIPGQSVHGAREDDQVADQEMTESTQLTKSQKKRLRRKEKRRREQEENKKSGVAPNRSDEEDDTSIKKDSTDRVETVSKKKTKTKKQ